MTVATPELITERLVLWMPGPEYADEMQRYFADNRAHLERWSPAAPPSFYTMAFWHKRLATMLREHADGTATRFSLSWRDRSPREVIGTASLTEITRGPLQSCLLGYGLDQRAQGRGVMTEALRAVIDYAFTTLKLHRIKANYTPTNRRSGAVLKRLGFVVEGYARDYLFINGAWRDHVLTALLNPAPIRPSEPRVSRAR